MHPTLPNGYFPLGFLPLSEHTPGRVVLFVLLQPDFCWIAICVDVSTEICAHFCAHYSDAQLLPCPCNVAINCMLVAKPSSSIMNKCIKTQNSSDYACIYIRLIRTKRLLLNANALWQYMHAYCHKDWSNNWFEHNCGLLYGFIQVSIMELLAFATHIQSIHQSASTCIATYMLLNERFLLDTFEHKLRFSKSRAEAGHTTQHG